MKNNITTELQFLIYDLPDDSANVQVVIKDETIWMTQKAMGQLFGCSTDNLGLHLKNIYESEELQEMATAEKILVVQTEGNRQVSRNTQFYNLDAIISVGYRVNSQKATRFRQWATKILNEYIRKGFVLDDDRLKQGKAVFGRDYFRELLERVRSIRASERRNHIFQSRPYARKYGFADLEKLTRWANTKIRCDSCEKLPYRTANTPIGAYCYRLF